MRTLQFTSFFICLLTILSCNSSKESGSNLENLPENGNRIEEMVGIYRGMMPCTDCLGIKTELNLKNDNSYELKTQNMEETDSVISTKGTFSFSGDSLLILSDNKLEFLWSKSELIPVSKRSQLKDSENFKLLKDSYPLLGTKWELAELMGAAVSPNEDTQTPYIQLNINENTIGGFAGCNGFGGNYELNPETLRLSFNELISTMMACPELNVENTLKEVLQKVDNYTHQDDQLMIYKGRTAALAKFRAVFFE